MLVAEVMHACTIVAAGQTVSEVAGIMEEHLTSSALVKKDELVKGIVTERDILRKVVAKGINVHAQKILEAARQYGIPVVRNVPLAHALNKLDVGDEIPEELFEAVAEVLTFVYNLANEQKKKR